MGSEAMTVRSPALLPIENAGNDSVWIMNGQTTHQRHRVLVSAHGRWTATWQVEIDLGKSAAAPTQCEVRTILILVDGDDDLFEQAA
jgi:hypothetical protein